MASRIAGPAKRDDKRPPKRHMVAWKCARTPACHHDQDGTEMPASFTQIYRAFAYNNAWANHRLLTACASLSQQEFEAERTGFFPSLRLTLNHIYVIDLFYVDALEGGWLGPKAWENEVPCRSLAELRPAQAEVDNRLIAVCDALTPALLDGIVRVNRDTRVQTERRDRLLMHSLPAPDSPSGTGTCHAFLNRSRTAATRRILFNRGSAVEGHRVRRSWLDRRNRMGTALAP
jgi:uncharacterized damage-inducible protein DinB